MLRMELSKRDIDDYVAKIDRQAEVISFLEVEALAFAAAGDTDAATRTRDLCNLSVFGAEGDRQALIIEILSIGAAPLEETAYPLAHSIIKQFGVNPSPVFAAAVRNLARAGKVRKLQDMLKNI